MALLTDLNVHRSSVWVCVCVLVAAGADKIWNSMTDCRIKAFCEKWSGVIKIISKLQWAENNVAKISGYLNK